MNVLIADSELGGVQTQTSNILFFAFIVLYFFFSFSLIWNRDA